jgi:hypothetical protein
MRLQLMQEFFFHILGAREVLAVLINEKRKLGLDPEEISIGKLAKALPSGDILYPMISELAVDPRKHPFPTDPYTEAAYIYRAVLYRNQVAHRHRVPVLKEVMFPDEPKTFLQLDPRNPDAGHSKFEAIPELRIIRDQLTRRYKNICDAIK